MTDEITRVKRFLEAWPVSGQDDEIHAVWINNEPEQRRLLKSDLEALLKEPTRLLALINEVRVSLGKIVAWTQWKEQPRNGMRINMRLVHEEAEGAANFLLTQTVLDLIKERGRMPERPHAGGEGEAPHWHNDNKDGWRP